MNVRFFSVLLRYHLRPLRHQIERGDRNSEAEPGEGPGLAHERTLHLKALGFIVQEVLFNIKALTVLSEGVHAGGPITDDRPILYGPAVTGQRQQNNFTLWLSSEWQQSGTTLSSLKNLQHTLPIPLTTRWRASVRPATNGDVQ